MAHPVCGKDRSPPDRNNLFSRTNFLPINADLGHTKGSSSCCKTSSPNPNLKHQAKDLLKEDTAIFWEWPSESGSFTLSLAKIQNAFEMNSMQMGL
jgi:hypothetical protein